ncbi:hypothetical protein AOQ84DRAFT_353068 [Glonium stellatum]|uniref:Uncharacterized protein n=1 Tax=Glonium stellatum TaxID=574774 RepID=A0A8E2F6B8_9PEZI|nr:hypothetical protein AOQ84DRAFT_353068 [Glonium stellatum]
MTLTFGLARYYNPAPGTQISSIQHSTAVDQKIPTISVSHRLKMQQNFRLRWLELVGRSLTYLL